MADVLIKGLKMGISSAVETAFNTKSTSNYHAFDTASASYHIPTSEKFDDRGRVGGNESDLPNYRFTGYINPVTLEITSPLNTFIHAILLRRGSGETYPPAAGTNGTGGDAGAYTHSFKIAKTVTQLPSSSVIWALPGADYVWTGETVNSWRVEQTRSDAPQFTCSMIGTGKSASTSGLTLNSFIQPVELSGAETQIYYTRNGVLTNIADRVSGIQRVTGWEVAANMNNRVDDRRPGDPRVISGDPGGGHYVNRMTNGDREITGGITLAIDSAGTPELADSLADQILTDFTFETKGRKFIPNSTSGVTSIQYGIKFIFPKCYINMTDPTNDNGLAVVRGDIFPVYDSTAATNLKIIVYNDTATLV